MKIGLRKLFAAAVAMSLGGALQYVHAQSDFVGYQFRYSSGQHVVPMFAGWSKNPDGSFTMTFGYLNRNYVEEVIIPIGPNNSIEPGGPDRGQPTYFYTRENRSVFSVTVPKDFGKKELIWALTLRGKTHKAVGWLQPEWEIPPPRGQATPARGADPAAPKNQPPTVAFEGNLHGTVSQPMSVTATITDDGLPVMGAGKGRGAAADASGAPQRRSPVGQETPPILQPTKETVDAPVNLPELQLGLRGAPVAPRPPAGPSVTYTLWRAPATVKFDPRFAVPKDGKAVTKMAFTEPGEYVLKVRATDGAAATTQELKITVAP